MSFHLISLYSVTKYDLEIIMDIFKCCQHNHLLPPVKNSVLDQPFFSYHVADTHMQLHTNANLVDGFKNLNSNQLGFMLIDV